MRDLMLSNMVGIVDKLVIFLYTFNIVSLLCIFHILISVKSFFSCLVYLATKLPVFAFLLLCVGLENFLQTFLWIDCLCLNLFKASSNLCIIKFALWYIQEFLKFLVMITYFFFLTQVWMYYSSNLSLFLNLFFGLALSGGDPLKLVLSLHAISFLGLLVLLQNNKVCS